MNTLNERIRHQILMEGPQICDDDERELYVSGELNAMNNMELLERISAAIASMPQGGLDHE